MFVSSNENRRRGSRKVPRFRNFPSRGRFSVDLSAGEGIVRRNARIGIALSIAALLLLCGSFAEAQSGGPSGRGSTVGDPAASSANPAASPSTTTGSANKPSRSGSGTSTSGGSDANGDQGRDKMPDSNTRVRPLNQQHKPEH